MVTNTMHIWQPACYLFYSPQELVTCVQINTKLYYVYVRTSPYNPTQIPHYLYIHLLYPLHFYTYNPKVTSSLHGGAKMSLTLSV